MDRNQIAVNSEVITHRYWRMLNEMNRGSVDDIFLGNNGYENFFYIKIIELSRIWIGEEKTIWMLLSDFFVALHAAGLEIAVQFISDGSSLSIYVGCLPEYMEMLDGMLRGIFQHVRYEPGESGNRIYPAQMLRTNFGFSGIIKGNPGAGENLNARSPLDSIIKGMSGLVWSISLFARPVSRSSTVSRQQYWLSEASLCSELSQVSYSSTDNNETLSYRKSYFLSEQYCKKVEAFCNRLVESTAMGEWIVSVSFSSDTREHAGILGGLMASAYYNADSEPEPVHAMYQKPGKHQVLGNGLREQYVHTEFGEISYPKYATYVSGRELAIYASFPTQDTAGLTIRDYVSFDVNQNTAGDLPIGCIMDMGRETGNTYKVITNDFNRHCLVIGLTGSGKTNTVKSLICSLTGGNTRPVMVIEPAKKEYWELYKLGFDSLQIYSVGSGEPFTHKLCLNPFERAVYTAPGGIRKAVPIQTHIDFVYAAFKASFIMYTPMPYILERAIYSIYEDCGWDIHNNCNTLGKEIYPTIEDLYDKIPEVVTSMGYDSKMRSDLIGSLQARINSMRLGSKGDTLNVERSFSIDRLLSGNVVIELEDIGDDDVKAFIISLLLVNLLEYRRQQEDCQKEVRHLLLIEEAHRLLKNVQSGTGESADPRGAAVEFFCNLLAELRSKGQGFIVADQIPSKLAPDLIKNTNLKITHRTVAAEERELIGGAMHMTPEQIDSIASLEQGVAAVYSEGDQRPKLVKSRYAGTYLLPERQDMTRDQVLSAIRPNCIIAKGDPAYCSLTNAIPLLCKQCGARCHRKYSDILSYIPDKAYFEKFADYTNPKHLKSCKAIKVHECILSFLREQRNPPSADLQHERFCLLGCLLDKWNLDPKLTEQLIINFAKIKEE